MKNPTPKADPNEKPDPNRWVSVAEYARLCGVSGQIAIRGRIDRGTVVAVEQDLLDGSTVTFIDRIASPPAIRYGGRGRKVPTNPAKPSKP